MKKNFKSLLALLLALTLVLSACSGSGKKTEEPKKDGEKTTETNKEDSSKAPAEALKGEISVQAETGWKEYYEAAAKKIMDANKDVKITILEKGAFDHLDLIDSTDATNKDVADVFALPADRIENLAKKQVLAAFDVKALAEKLGGFENYDAGLGGILKFNNEYLAFPYNIETLVTFVNTANAKAAGIDASKPLELNDVKDASTILLPIFDAWYGVAATNSAKINLLSKEGDKVSTDMTKTFAELSKEQQDLFNSLFNYWKLNKEAKSTLFDAEAGWGYIDDQFKVGQKGVIRLGGPWDSGNFATLVGLENLEVYPMSQITINGKPLTHWQGGWGLGINARIEEDKDKMALAQAFIAEIVNPKNAVSLFKATGKILENVPNEVYQKSDLSDLDKKVIANVFESFKVSPARPVFNEFGKVWDTYKNAVLSWNSSNPTSGEEAYNLLKSSFESMMTNLNK